VPLSTHLSPVTGQPTKVGILLMADQFKRHNLRNSYTFDPGCFPWEQNANTEAQLEGTSAYSVVKICQQNKRQTEVPKYVVLTVS
jgi:hypothetical protein